jgi:protein SDA1
MLFGMVERGMALDFVGDKGKAKAVSDSALGLAGQDAMWAVIFTKELWRKSIWFVPPCRAHFTLTFQKE